MNAITGLSREFAEFANLIHWDVVDQSDVWVVASPGSEIRFLLRIDTSGSVTLSTTQRREAESVVLVTDSVLVAERYLTVCLGSEIRPNRGLKGIVFPWREADLPQSLRLAHETDDMLRLVGASDSILFADLGTPQEITRYAHYSAFPLTQLRESLLHPAGAPLLVPYLDS